MIHLVSAGVYVFFLFWQEKERMPEFFNYQTFFPTLKNQQQRKKSNNTKKKNIYMVKTSQLLYYQSIERITIQFRGNYISFYLNMNNLLIWTFIS